MTEHTQDGGYVPPPETPKEEPQEAFIRKAMSLMETPFDVVLINLDDGARMDFENAARRVLSHVALHEGAKGRLSLIMDLERDGAGRNVVKTIVSDLAVPLKGEVNQAGQLRLF